MYIAGCIANVIRTMTHTVSNNSYNAIPSRNKGGDNSGTHYAHVEEEETRPTGRPQSRHVRFLVSFHKHSGRSTTQVQWGMQLLRTSAAHKEQYDRIMKRFYAYPKDDVCFGDREAYPLCSLPSLCTLSYYSVQR